MDGWFPLALSGLARTVVGDQFDRPVAETAAFLLVKETQEGEVVLQDVVFCRQQVFVELGRDFFNADTRFPP
jgi:hypothetical protein